MDARTKTKAPDRRLVSLALLFCLREWRPDRPRCRAARWRGRCELVIAAFPVGFNSQPEL